MGRAAGADVVPGNGVARLSTDVNLIATPRHIDEEGTGCFNGRFVSGDKMANGQRELYYHITAALANRQGARRAADTLNRNNIPSATGRPWTRRMVYNMCKSLGIKNPYYTSEEVARWQRPHRGLSATSMYEHSNEGP